MKSNGPDENKVKKIIFKWKIRDRKSHPEAGHVLVQQTCCHSTCPIKLDMTFKVGRRRRTECPPTFTPAPQWSPRVAGTDECVCVC